MRDSYIPSALIVYLTVSGLLHAAAHSKAKRTSNGLTFGPTLTIRLLLMGGIFGFACGAIYVALTPPQSLLGGLIFGLISVAGTIAFPADIALTQSSVESTRWWVSRTTILWTDVQRIEYHKGQSMTVIFSKHGPKTVHSGFNRDSKGFLANCENRTGIVATEIAI